MPWLFIDSCERGRLRLALIPKTGRIRTRVVRKPRVNVPTALSAFVTTTDELKGVCVVAGPGSFSAVRGGVLAANMTARVLGLPLIGVSVEEAVDLNALRERMLKGDVPRSSYVAPVYDAEPNITC